MGLLGAGAIIWGSLQALVAERLKLLVAYSTVAQIGYLFLIFPLSSIPQSNHTAWQGGLYFALSHACAKSAAFLAAGTVIYSFGHDRIKELHGIVRRMPVSMFAFALAGVSLIGLPPSGGFIAKWLYLNAALTGGQWWWCVLIITRKPFGNSLYISIFFACFQLFAGGRRRAPGALDHGVDGLRLGLVCADSRVHCAGGNNAARRGQPLLIAGG